MADYGSFKIMTTIEFDFIGWVCEGNSDKIWTAFRAENQFYSGWGRRGKKLQFKALSSNEAADMIHKKFKKYSEITEAQMTAMVPHFVEDLEQWLIMDTMGGKVR